MVHRLFSHRFYWRKTDRSLYDVFQSVTFFLDSSCAKFHVQTSGWTELFKQVQRHYLILDPDHILYNYLLRFSFDVLIFLPIYCCAVGQIESKLQEHEFFWFEKKRDSTSAKLHAAALCNFTVTCSSKHQGDIWVSVCTLFASVHSAFVINLK